MFACKKTFISPRLIACLLILFGVLLCLPFAHAQQETKEEESGENRRIERLGEVSADEWEMDLALPAAAPVAPSNGDAAALPDALQNEELQQLLSNLAANPSSNKVLAQLNTLLTVVLAQANASMDGGSIDEAEQMLTVIQSIDPYLHGLKTAQRRLVVLREARDLVETGNIALEAGHVIEPENDNALYYFNQALLKDPNNTSVGSGLIRVQETLILRSALLMLMWTLMVCSVPVTWTRLIIRT